MRCLAVFSLTALAGCGGGRLHVITQQTQTIDEHQPLISSFDVREAYWWTDDAGRLRVAMRAEPEGLYLGALTLSLELEGMPAGSGREYALRTRGMRATYAFSEVPALRMRSFRGVAAVWPQGGDRLKVRYRVMAQSQGFTLVLGWRPGSTRTVTGECLAVRNERRGRELYADSEEGDWARPAPATTTAPATRANPTPGG